MEPFLRQQRLEGTTTTTPRPDESRVDKYTQFLFLLVSSILILASLMCVARIIFVYCSYKRRQQDERHRRTQTRTVTVDAGPNRGFSVAHDSGGVTNYGFADPPPRYDQLFKREEPPPLYASVRDSQIITSPRPSTGEDETHSLPPYEEDFATAQGSLRSDSMRTGSFTTALAALNGNALPDTGQVIAREVDIGVMSQQIQSQMEAVQQRHMGPADLTTVRAAVLSDGMPPS